MGPRIVTGNYRGHVHHTHHRPNTAARLAAARPSSPQPSPHRCTVLAGTGLPGPQRPPRPQQLQTRRPSRGAVPGQRASRTPSSTRYVVGSVQEFSGCRSTSRRRQRRRGCTRPVSAPAGPARPRRHLRDLRSPGDCVRVESTPRPPSGGQPGSDAGQAGRAGGEPYTARRRRTDCGTGRRRHRRRPAVPRRPLPTIAPSVMTIMRSASGW